jgi:iron-sulfur cluster assembly accessory protein
VENGQQPVLSVTPKAADHILSIMKNEGAEGQALRIRTVPGGCSGFEYALDFVPVPQPEDAIVEAEGLRVCVDQGSIERLAGMVIDYVTGQYGGSLQFINPRAAHTCGCGTSFSNE